MITTKDVLLNYIHKRFYDHGFDGSRLDSCRDVFAALRHRDSAAVLEINCLGRQMEEHAYHSAFIDLATEQFDILGECPQSTYTDILSQIFGDREISWAKLILVIVYTGRLAVKAVIGECHDLVRCLVDWCQSFFTVNYLEQWVNANGGWNAFTQAHQADWEDKDILSEMKSVAFGLTVATGIVSTFYYILRGQ